MSTGPSNLLTPLPHPLMDFIIAVLISPWTTPQSMVNLKLCLIPTARKFTLASISVRNRLSLLTSEVGVRDAVRKTPFLGVGEVWSKARQATFIRETDARSDEANMAALGVDDFLVRDMKGKKRMSSQLLAMMCVCVFSLLTLFPLEKKETGCDKLLTSLDVVLQRKAKDHISGLILIIVAEESICRAQMDLVFAHAEATSVPIYPFSYGHAYDTALLWLMLSHTSGKYTFISDWCDLKDCIVGCVSGMMSIALLSVKFCVKIVYCQ
jgi:hypothetical protein